ncbi:MAG: hypothetical protein KIT73_06080 [Burkholderiales bacterium]|nr:hypothetical protein [Burkholderiales bacterium]
MSMKKTDLAKNLAKKIDGKMKSSVAPQRFAQGSAKLKEKIEPKSKPTAPKLVPVSCRLPAELVNRLRDRAVGHEGGISALVTQAVEQWLGSTDANE